MMSTKDYRWIKRFDPNKRVFVGRAYFFVKRLMDLLIIFLASPVWIPVIFIIYLSIFVSAPSAQLFIQINGRVEVGKHFCFTNFVQWCQMQMH